MVTAPWIDLHAHPGRFFLDGLPDDSALARGNIGGARSDPREIVRSGMSVVSFATVSDLQALRATEGGGLTATGSFDVGTAYADHLRQLEAAARAAERIGLQPLRGGADLVGPHGPRMLLACEGADFLEYDGANLAETYRRGVRSVQLVHYRPNAYGDLQTASAVHDGLSAAGAEVVREMNRLGMIVDLAHATYETTRDAVWVSDQPVMISHSHLAGAGREHPRFVSADHARVVAETGGVIGVWPAGFSLQTLEDYVGEIVRLVEVVGVEHVGVGTDMDANYRPVLTSYGQFAVLRDALSSRGFGAAEVDGVLGGNAEQLIRTVCG
ncbi:dipeptidase [Leekyejoonella antrihumi]|uniref:Membrane dipeptidase n=1 Tax=Leekyejoonella antrihumi TaxID=1660198 RepID=A0A563E8K2_9MICO|nr:membrane dipeptidase [Leekyejoonella antrihumi]TWP38531.1 hypothetical protein FGL98_01680 [Leekyejoonella antrihumi]